MVSSVRRVCVTSHTPGNDEQLSWVAFSKKSKGAKSGGACFPYICNNRSVHIVVCLLHSRRCTARHHFVVAYHLGILRPSPRKSLSLRLATLEDATR